ncbi:hypothetical protein [Xanthocytophaga flava]|nr:hypothetical protein [Xanthocytophaga flavus]MDJ1473160.1 hypothetical protein [Xanthocytophaga flavus]
MLGNWAGASPAPTLVRHKPNHSGGKRLGDLPIAPTGYRNHCC